MIRPRLKTLEALVLQAAADLKRLSSENKKLKLDFEHLREEYGKREEEIKRLRVLGTRQARLRSKIERLVERLDKVAG